MSKDSEFLFLPLGGAEEIGMNLNLYGIDDKWLMVDLEFPLERIACLVLK